MPDSPGAAVPHVVMLSGNDVRTDNRIRRTAVSVARLGLRVTLVALAPDGVRSTTQLGPVTVVRVPVGWTMRDGVAKRRARRRRPPALIGYASPTEEMAAATRARLAVESARLDPGAGARLRGRYWTVRELFVRVRRRGQREFGRVYRRAWQARDKAWSFNPAGVSWQRTVPHVLDYELAYAAVIDALRPDVIHAHDVELVHTAERASARARAAGRHVPWVYDAHEFVPGLARYGSKTRRVVAAFAELEAAHIRDAAAVITVSPQIADAQQARYSLPQRPVVVLNAPPRAETARGGGPGGAPSLRSAAGVGPDAPLLVYSGGVTPARGVRTLVQAMAHLPSEVHLAVVAVPHVRTTSVEALRDEALRLGVSDRLHLLDPVAPHQVVGLLSEATVGVHPLPGGTPNHEMALPNKLFEYIHAGLPLVVSDAAALASFVRENDLGATFVSADAVDLARAVRDVLGDLPRLQARVADPTLRARFTWEQQERGLRTVYEGLVGAARLTPQEDLGAFPPVGSEQSQAQRRRAAGERRLVIGPANMAGQAWAWSEAVRRALPGTTAEVVAVAREGLTFPCDVRVAAADFARGTTWQQGFFEHVVTSATHVLLEAGRPLAGTLHGRTFAGDAAALRAAGVEVGLVFHGSEIRDPRRHAARGRWSPYADPTEELTARLQRVVDELAPLVADFDGPVFVSTPDLLDDVPGATWLPVAVDVDEAGLGTPPLLRDVPVVVHAPSRSALKGTALAEPVLERLQAEGLVSYRRVEGVPPQDMPALLADADVVLDQFALGSYGVLACQAMAAGRVCVGHVRPDVRARLPESLPVVQAEPDTLEAVLRGLLADRSGARAAAAEGPRFVRRWHDGRASAAVLAQFLGLPAPPVD